MCGRVERWFERYPAEDATHLAGRFRKDIESQHCPALFELFVHEHLRRSGYQMRCELPVFGRRIDFLAHRYGKPAFYVEAKSPSESEAKRLANRYRGEVMDLLNKYRAPGFLVSVRLSGTPTRPVPMKQFKLASELEKWCDGLDRRRSLEQRRERPGHVEVFEWPPAESWADSPHEVTLHIDAMPQAQDPPVDFNSFAQVTHAGDAFIYCPDLPIADAIAEKATRYGDLELPFIVAVNVSEFSTTGREARDGIEAGFAAAGRRARDLVSGVLLSYVPNIAAAVAMASVLYVNPHAKRPLGAHAKFFRPLQDRVEVRMRRP